MKIYFDADVKKFSAATGSPLSRYTRTIPSMTRLIIGKFSVWWWNSISLLRASTAESYLQSENLTGYKVNFLSIIPWLRYTSTFEILFKKTTTLNHVAGTWYVGFRLSEGFIL